jgi:hypothetical protein
MLERMAIGPRYEIDVSTNGVVLRDYGVADDHSDEWDVIVLQRYEKSIADWLCEQHKLRQFAHGNNETADASPGIIYRFVHQGAPASLTDGPVRHAARKPLLGILLSRNRIGAWLVTSQCVAWRGSSESHDSVTIGDIQLSVERHRASHYERCGGPTLWRKVIGGLRVTVRSVKAKAAWVELKRKEYATANPMTAVAIAAN